MAAHTANAGKIYFVGGTPDPADVFDGLRQNLGASVLRELEEETGITAENVQPDTGWHAVFAGPRIAMLKVLNSRLRPAQLVREIRAFLQVEPKPELADVRVCARPC